MKKPQTQKPKPATLKQVVSRASTDKVFLNSLVRAPAATLKNNALKLTAADGKKLKTLIARTGSVKDTLGVAQPPCPADSDWAPIP